MKRAVLLLALACGGCLPVVQHGPWVHKGSSGVIGASGGVTGEFDQGTALHPFFSFDGGMRVGFTPNDSSHNGGSIGVQLPLLSLLAVADAGEDSPFAFLHFLNLDGFITGPEAGGLNSALGMTVSQFHIMPYLQAGRYDEWYGTLAVMFARELGMTIIAPSYTKVTRRNARSISHVTVTAGLGNNGDETLLMAGVTIMFEFHRVRP